MIFVFKTRNVISHPTIIHVRSSKKLSRLQQTVIIMAFFRLPREVDMCYFILYEKNSKQSVWNVMKLDQGVIKYFFFFKQGEKLC